MKPLAIPEGPLTESERLMYYDALKKSVGIVYLLWFFLGYWGVHRIFAGRVVSGISMFILSVVSIILSIVVIGFLGLAIVGIWWIIDLFLIGGWIRAYNEDLIRKLGGHPSLH